MAFQGFILMIPSLHVEGMALFPFILIKRMKPDKALLNHEQIHLRQQLELGIIPFYVFYLSEYLFRLAVHRSHSLAYVNISFEQEAFKNQHDLNYLKDRKWFAFMRYWRSES